MGITREKFIDSYNELIKNNEFKLVEELVDEIGEQYFKLHDNKRRVYLTNSGKFLERITYRATDGIGWKEIFYALAWATVLERTNKGKDYIAFLEETIRTVGNEAQNSFNNFSEEIKKTRPSEPFEKIIY